MFAFSGTVGFLVTNAVSIELKVCPRAESVGWHSYFEVVLYIYI